jgi:muconolactone delta-isomerase
MRFLVVSHIKHPMPPNAELLDAMAAWVDQHLQDGKMEQAWNFAGLAGGGGILNVASLEELDEVMIGFPLGPFSQVDIYGLTDLHASLDRIKAKMA